MNSLKDYFHTDWASMTLHDWIGTIMTVLVFVLMVWLYVYVFNPKNKERLESQRHIPIDEDNIDTEKNNE